MNHVPRLALALAILALLSSHALAWGIVRLDTRLTNQTAEELQVGEVGDALYDVQEGTHDTVTDTTGVEIEHSYVDVCLGDECVPVDPIHFNT